MMKSKGANKFEYPFRIKVVEHRTELLGVMKLRFNVYCKEKKYLKIDNNSMSTESDKYDPFSVHFVAIDNNHEVLGACRLIMNSRIGFPIEETFNIRHDFKSTEVAEMSRFIIVEKARSLNLAEGLFKVCFDYAISRGITHWFAILESDLMSNYKEKYGFPFIQLGEMKQHMGGVTGPYLLNLETMLLKVKDKNRKMFNFLKNSFDGIIFESSELSKII